MYSHTGDKTTHYHTEERFVAHRGIIFNGTSIHLSYGPQTTCHPKFDSKFCFVLFFFFFFFFLLRGFAPRDALSNVMFIKKKTICVHMYLQIEHSFLVVLIYE